MNGLGGMLGQPLRPQSLASYCRDFIVIFSPGGSAMNIMQIVSGTEVNGAIRHCLRLTRGLIRRSHRLTLVCRPGAWIALQLPSEPVEVVESDLHRWPTDQLRRIAAIVEQRQIDVVHTHLSRAHCFGVLLRWLSRVPCVATAQSRHIQLHWMFNDRVIALSDKTRRFHQTYNLVRADRIVTIPNCVAVDHIREAPIEGPSRLLASIGVEERLSPESRIAQFEAVYASVVARARAA